MNPYPSNASEEIAILHLEDNALDAELVQRALERASLPNRIHRVDNEEDFRSALTRGGYHLILADYTLPSYDGMKALDAAYEFGFERPFIFVSATLGEEVAVESLKRGATDYVTKQRLDRLPLAVRRALHESRLRIERKRAEEALAESQELFRHIVESASEYAIFTMSMTGFVTSWNEGAERLLGYDDGSIVGKDASVIFTPEDRTQGVPALERRQALAEGKAADERWHLRQDGSKFWGSGSLTPLKNNRGEVRGFLKILRDRTEGKAAEEALRERDRRKDEFLAMLAHELRNPVAPIRNALYLLRHQAEDESIRGLHEMIERQVLHLVRLIDDLLDVARISKGKITLQRMRVDLGELAQHAVEDRTELLRSIGRELSLRRPPTPLPVYGDPTRLAQILDNLVENAAKFTSAGGNITVRADYDAAGTMVVLEVQDDGIGIDAETLPKLFEAFAQADNSLDRSRGGLGLGLTLARGLAELHGGTLSARSDGPGRGSVFTARIPVAESNTMVAAESNNESAENRSRKVLIIEDNVDAAYSLKMLLELSGHEVAVAHNGSDGISAVLAERPEVVVCDIGLPGMDGFEVAKDIRSRSELQDIMLIAMTGYGQEEDRARALAAGFDLHVVKPVDPEKLLRILGQPQRVEHA